MKIQDELWNEEAMLELLGITRDQLDYLRLEKDFPTVRLGKRVRLYSAKAVLSYVAGIASQEGSVQSQADVD